MAKKKTYEIDGRLTIRRRSGCFAVVDVIRDAVGNTTNREVVRFDDEAPAMAFVKERQPDH